MRLSRLDRRSADETVASRRRSIGRDGCARPGQQRTNVVRPFSRDPAVCLAEKRKPLKTRRSGWSGGTGERAPEERGIGTGRDNEATRMVPLDHLQESVGTRRISPTSLAKPCCRRRILRRDRYPGFGSWRRRPAAAWMLYEAGGTAVEADRKRTLFPERLCESSRGDACHCTGGCVRRRTGFRHFSPRGRSGRGAMEGHAAAGNCPVGGGRASLRPARG